MSKVDLSDLKMKPIASIVAISVIDPLNWFMSIDLVANISEMDRKPYRLVVIHMAFVISGLVLALMDYLVSKTNKH